MTYRVRFSAYCGLSYTVGGEHETREEARATAATLLRLRRKRFDVATHKRGAWWEILEPNDAAMVPDRCGMLYLQHDTHECIECDTSHELQGEADECCTQNDEDYDNE